MRKDCLGLGYASQTYGKHLPRTNELAYFGQYESQRDTTTTVTKTLRIMTLLITLLNVALHICFYSNKLSHL
jgi:hypothetical protein